MKYPINFILRVCIVAAAGLYSITSSAAAGVATNEALLSADKLYPEQFIAQVLQRHPRLRLRQAEVDASVARIEQVSALADPVISYSFAPQTRNKSNQDFGQKLMFSQKLPWPGKRDLAAEIQSFESEASKDRIDTERLSLILQAKKAYADWYLAHAAIQINKRSTALWKEFLHLAELNYATGKSGKQDVLKAEVESYRLEHRAIALQRQKKAARSRINELLNRDPDAFVPPPSAMTQQPQALRPVQDLLAIAAHNRPEIHAIDEQIRAANSRIKRTKLGDYPDFNVMAGWNSLWNDEDKRWMVGVSMNLPLDSVKRGAAKSEARAKLIRLNSSREQLLNEIQTEVQDAFDALVEARHVLKLYNDKLLPVARENLAASRRDYQSGAGDFLSLISAEKNLFQTELENEKSKAAFYRSMAELSKATAGSLIAQPDKSMSNANDTQINLAGDAQ